MIKEINNAKFIVLHVDKKYLPSASAVYTYILTLHKKVAIVCEEDIEINMMFLPWLDKSKKISPSSADLNIDLTLSAFELFELYQTNKIKINKKMATALYTGLLIETNSFLNNVNGMKFAMARVLLECEADVKTSVKFIKSTSLSLLRLKSFLLKNLLLSENATIASLHVDDKLLKSSGAEIQECEKVMLEVIELPHVKEVRLIKTDESNKIIKTINKEIF